jgi:hypothetical protein
MVLAGSIALGGCSTTPVYVLDQKEIIVLKKGDTLIVPYDGTFYSARAEQRVMEVKKSAIK